MDRNIKEVFYLLIKLEDNFSNFYKNISVFSGKNISKIKTVALVLSREEKGHAQLYRDFLQKYQYLNEVIIEDRIYEKARDIVNEFKKTLQLDAFKNEKELIELAIYYEEKNSEVLKSILEITPESNVNLIELLTLLIKIEDTHAENLKKFI
ncbi:ferritin family protein [Herbivorax sp. ANBcel31]|uniref:ferritin family protein n=1 Tax=Herbivorax sp. ANBcel31 TaxID=3069754 RepID=UPI0027B2B050|nr:ferritin family protein [Herbivorax sp. ANBcel31]MDQ2085060.1 ferritin family protein [Herbivorax sp. ANBcel31]